MNFLLLLLICFVNKHVVCSHCSWCSPGAVLNKQFFKSIQRCDPKAVHRFKYKGARRTTSNGSHQNQRQILFGTNSLNSNSYDSCSKTIVRCNPNYKYRSFDGSCNNLNNPTWTMANTTFARILPAAYRDGVSLSRLATDGNLLPSARTLSVTFFPDVNNQNMQVTLAVMQWGQFVAHDTIASASIAQKINCCDGSNGENENMCLPIQISQNDPFYSQFNITCQDMVRHAVIPTSDCGGIAQQINAVSHLIDGSQIYGSDKNIVKSLRELQGGRLLIQMCNPKRTFLPTVDGRTYCDSSLENNTIYLAGDFRVNQNPQLSIMQTLFAREHNRIANQLQQMHPGWNDERLYQEARAIVIAELQHITYNEWLPLLLGTNFMTSHGLLPNYYRNFVYNSTISPATINSFATGAFRIGHSGIQGQIRMCDNYNTCPVKELNFSDWLERPGIIQQQENFDELLRGLINQPMQNLDNYYTQQITQQFMHGNNSFGTDLLSIDIQRGRDHGIPSYVDFLEICMGNRPQRFSDLVSVIKPEFIPLLQNQYTNVNDIDLFIGGNLEITAQGSRVGPTFQCIVGEQFYRYKYGDRYWYEIRGQRHSFTNGQLYEIKKVTLSRIICDNSDGIINISPSSFLQTGERNNPVACDQIQSVNLSRWR